MRTVPPLGALRTTGSQAQGRGRSVQGARALPEAWPPCCIRHTSPGVPHRRPGRMESGGYRSLLQGSLGEVRHLDEASRSCRVSGWMLAAVAPEARRRAPVGAWFSLEAALMQVTYSTSGSFCFGPQRCSPGDCRKPPNPTPVGVGAGLRPTRPSEERRVQGAGTRRSGGQRRQADREGTSGARFGAHGDAPLVRIDYVTRDRQTKTRPLTVSLP